MDKYPVVLPDTRQEFTLPHSHESSEGRAVDPRFPVVQDAARRREAVRQREDSAAHVPEAGLQTSAGEAADSPGAEGGERRELI